MGSTTAGHHIEHTAKTFSAWRVIIGGIVVGLAWFAGQAGWLSISPGDRVRKLESISAAMELRIDAQEEQMGEFRATQRFMVELLCLPKIEGAAVSDGDRILKNQCRLFVGPSR